MAKILQCGGCRQTMDITDLEVGSTVQCPECGQTARVPSGNTSLRTKTVSAPIPATPAPSGGSRVGSSPRNQRVRERSRSGTMAAPPQQTSSHGGLFVGLGIGVLGVVIVVILFTMKDKDEETAARAKTPPPLRGPATVTFNPTLPPGDGKPIVLRDGSKGDAPKPTTLSRPAESADNANWAVLMNQLRPGGGFEHLDRPEGEAFQKVKSFGPAAYPKLIGFIEDEDPNVAIAAVAVLNALTGRDEPHPKGVNKAKCKAEWEEWLKKAAPAPKPEEAKK